MRQISIVFVLAATGLISWLAWTQTRTQPFVVSGFVEADEIRVGSRVGGRVADVLVTEGKKVAPGAALYRLDPFNLQEQLAQARAHQASSQAELDRLKSGYRMEEIEQARARCDQLGATLDRLVAGPRPGEIEIARQQVLVAEASMTLAESENTRLLRLRESAQAAEKEMDESARALKSARAELAAARQQLALLEEGTRKEEIAQARAALAEARQALKLLEQGYRPEDIAKARAEMEAAQANASAIEKQMQELLVMSPCDCVVETIDLRPGDIVAPNAPTVSLMDLSKLWVRAYVPEGRLGEVRLDQRCFVRIDGLPGRRFAGHISFIAREGEFTPRNVQTPEERSKQVFRIKVMLDEGLDVLRVGMAADLLLDEKAGS